MKIKVWDPVVRSRAAFVEHFDPELLKIFFDHIDEVREIRLRNQDNK